MYGISTYTQMIFMVNVDKYTSPTDPICESGGVHTGARGVDPTDISGLISRRKRVIGDGQWLCLVPLKGGIGSI